MKKNINRFSFLFIILGIIWASFLIAKDCFFFYNLEKNGVETNATVISLEPQNHQSINYSYQVQSALYFGVGHEGFGTPEFNFIRPGMELRAFYLRSNPAKSCLGIPHEHINNLLPIFFVLIVVFTIFAWFALTFKEKMCEK